MGPQAGEEPGCTFPDSLMLGAPAADSDGWTHRSNSDEWKCVCQGEARFMSKEAWLSEHTFSTTGFPTFEVGGRGMP